MALKLTLPFRYVEQGNVIPGTTDTVDGDPSTNMTINDFVEGCTATGTIDSSDFSPNAINGPSTVPSLRTLNNQPGSAAPYDDPRFNNATAAFLKTTGAAVSIGGSAPPTGAGQVLISTSAISAQWGVLGSTQLTGLGTVYTTSGMKTVTGTGTTFTTELRIGWVITINGENKTIVAIADDTHLTVDSSFANNNTGVPFTFTIVDRVRPFDRFVDLNADYAVVASDVGTQFEVNTAGGDVTVTLLPSDQFLSGDTLTFKKVTDDTNAIILVVQAGEQMDGVSDGTLRYKTLNASVTLASDGATGWRVVAERFRPGTVIQSTFKSDASTPSGTTILPVDATIPQNTEGTEFLVASAVTPTSANTKIRVRGQINLAYHTGNARYFSIALFRDSIADALWATTEHVQDIGQTPIVLPFLHEFTSPGTSSMTVKLRAGLSGSGTILMNTDNDGSTNFFGGVWLSNIMVEEIAI